MVRIVVRFMKVAVVLLACIQTSKRDGREDIGKRNCEIQADSSGREFVGNKQGRFKLFLKVQVWCTLVLQKKCEAKRSKGRRSSWRGAALDASV